MKSLVVLTVLTYVMAPGPVFRRVCDGRDELNLTTLRVEGSADVAPAYARGVAEAIGVPWSAGPLSVSAAFVAKLPHRCRLELSSVESTRTVAAAWVNGKKKADPAAFDALQVAVEEACALLMLKTVGETESRSLLDRHLNLHKVDKSKISLARFNGTVAYAIGDRAPEAPQFFVYKDKFLPAKISYPDETGAVWQVRFIDYGSPATGEWFPRALEVWKGDELLLKVAVHRGDAKVRVDDASW